MLYSVEQNKAGFLLLLQGLHRQRESCSCLHHEGIWGSWGISPLILYLGTRWSWWCT